MLFFRKGVVIMLIFFCEKHQSNKLPHAYRECWLDFGWFLESFLKTAISQLNFSQLNRRIVNKSIENDEVFAELKSIIEQDNDIDLIVKIHAIDAMATLRSEVEKKKWSYYQFCRETSLTERVIKKIRSFKQENIDRKSLETILIALQLPFDQSIAILSAFGYCPNPFNIKDRILIYLLSDNIKSIAIKKLGYDYYIDFAKDLYSFYDR